MTDGSRLDYEEMAREALRGVVREAFRRIDEHGMPDGHHFYLSFATTAPGVSVPGFLSERYPREITVVFQHQFWNLSVGDDILDVTLAFGGSHHSLTIPWAAVTAFADPPARFALRFVSEDELGEEEDGEGEEADEEKEIEGQGSADARADVVSFERFKKDKS